MLKDDKYRFNLQWKADTVERCQVGELLEHLKNKKSDFVLAAILEYLHHHPEVATPGTKVVVQVSSTATDAKIMDAVQRLVEDMLAQHFSNSNVPGNIVPQVKVEPVPQIVREPSESDLDDMLANLDFFQ